MTNTSKKSHQSHGERSKSQFGKDGTSVLACTKQVISSTRQFDNRFIATIQSGIAYAGTELQAGTATCQVVGHHIPLQEEKTSI